MHRGDLEELLRRGQTACAADDGAFDDDQADAAYDDLRGFIADLPVADRTTLRQALVRALRPHVEIVPEVLAALPAWAVDHDAIAANLDRRAEVSLFAAATNEIDRLDEALAARRDQPTTLRRVVVDLDWDEALSGLGALARLIPDEPRRAPASRQPRSSAERRQRALLEIEETCGWLDLVAPEPYGSLRPVTSPPVDGGGRFLWLVGAVVDLATLARTPGTATTGFDAALGDVVGAIAAAADEEGRRTWAVVVQLLLTPLAPLLPERPILPPTASTEEATPAIHDLVDLAELLPHMVLSRWFDRLIAAVGDGSPLDPVEGARWAAVRQQVFDLVASGQQPPPPPDRIRLRLRPTSAVLAAEALRTHRTGDPDDDAAIARFAAAIERQTPSP